MSAGLLQESSHFSSHHLEGTSPWCPWEERRATNKWFSSVCLQGQWKLMEREWWKFIMLWFHADGPFKIPEGYRLCSTNVYINYSQAQTTKPFLLILPHWSGAADHPVFVTSPHTLPEGEQYYPFHLLEGGEFGEGYGIMEVDGHCSLFALVYWLEDTSRYYASLWEREEGNSRHSRVAISFADSVWIQVTVLCASLVCPMLNGSIMVLDWFV